MDQTKKRFVKDQRWISETEPELGLGKIVSSQGRYVVIEFAAAGIERHYAAVSAPLRRIRFTPGEQIKANAGETIRVEWVEERDDLLIYHGNGKTISEAELCGRISISSAEERLMAGQIDPPSLFDLRTRVWKHYHAVRCSSVRGFYGGRIALLAHQFFIASQVAQRPLPRVLLADETGLGKTIEACLILKRLIVSGRVERVLILVPEAMVVQWFVELLRKFDLSFTIVDEEFCRQSADQAPSENPFLGVQKVIAATNFLAEHGNRARQAAEAGWDLMLVDEAHHLKEGSPAHVLTAELARQVARLLLLTATPEQLGRRNHFSRLQLLDPERYPDYDAYLAESDHYHTAVCLMEKMFAKRPLSAEELSLLKEIAPDIDAAQYPLFDSNARNQILSGCVDRFGPGRAFFRNTRQAIKWSARRKAHLIPLHLPADRTYHLQRLANDFLAETDSPPEAREPDFMIDPRIEWLAGLLKKMASDKILLICTTPQKVRAIHAALSNCMQVDAAQFHEEMTLLQRDRNAAWFAEPDGARLLICSEIGSEGRNFQFASHLVLFDLPLDPEQLEQRIGRLDRIGQKSTVEIHVPYLIGSPQEILVRWFHEGLNLLEHNFAAGPQILETFGPEVRQIAGSHFQGNESDHKKFQEVLDATRRLRLELEVRLSEGRDRLLQYASFQPFRARHLIKAVKAADEDLALEKLMMRLFNHFGIEAEKFAKRTYRLSCGVRTNESFPFPCASETGATFDRETALKREDLLFLTWDHPLVLGAVETLLNASEGNCTVGIWPTPGPAGLILETIFILEPICLQHLHADRFMPPTPLRVAVDQNGRPLPDELLSALSKERLKPWPSVEGQTDVGTLGEKISFMLKSCRKLAEEQISGVIEDALKAMRNHLAPEIGRMQALRGVNSGSNMAEVEWRTNEIKMLQECLASPALRLDAVRLVLKKSGA